MSVAKEIKKIGRWLTIVGYVVLGGTIGAAIIAALFQSMLPPEILTLGVSVGLLLVILGTGFSLVVYGEGF